MVAGDVDRGLPVDDEAQAPGLCGQRCVEVYDDLRHEFCPHAVKVRLLHDLRHSSLGATRDRFWVLNRHVRDRLVDHGHCVRGSVAGETRQDRAYRDGHGLLLWCKVGRALRRIVSVGCGRHHRAVGNRRCAAGARAACEDDFAGRVCWRDRSGRSRAMFAVGHVRLDARGRNVSARWPAFQRLVGDDPGGGNGELDRSGLEDDEAAENGRNDSNGAQHVCGQEWASHN